MIVRLKQKEFKDRGLKIFPLEFKQVRPVPNWRLPPPAVDEERCNRRQFTRDRSIVRVDSGNSSRTCQSRPMNTAPPAWPEQGRS